MRACVYHELRANVCKGAPHRHCTRVRTGGGVEKEEEGVEEEEEEEEEGNDVEETEGGNRNKQNSHQR